MAKQAEMTEDSSPESEKTFWNSRSQDCAYLDRTAIFQLRSSMTLTEQLISASSLDQDLKASIANGGNKDAAKQVGKAVGERAVIRASKRFASIEVDTFIMAELRNSLMVHVKQD